jgi:hypothetical protein
MTGFFGSFGFRKAIFPYFPPSRRTSLVTFSSPSISSAYAGTGLRRRSLINPRIFWNKVRGTATSANWKVTYRPCRTTLAPIFTSFSRSVVSDQCSTSLGAGETIQIAASKQPRFKAGKGLKEAVNG